MGYKRGTERGQASLLPDCIEEYVGEDSPVRVIDAFCEGLDVESLGFRRHNPADTGRPGYAPRDLLKLYVYGYMNGVRSSRKLMREAGRNIEVMYLLCKLSPDFRTISDFRKDNRKALREVFREFVRLCVRLGLYKRELLAVDGTKVRAVNSKDRAYNAEILEKKLARIDNHIAEYMSDIDANDEREEKAPEKSAAEINEIVTGLKRRKLKYTGYLKELKSTGKTQILETDPEAHRMHTKDGFNCCYNVQTAVDAGSHLIAEYEVTGSNTDQGHLKKTVDSARELLGTETVQAVADKGYESRKDILECVMNGIVPQVGLKYDKTERVYDLEYIEREIKEEQRLSTKPEDIQACIQAGVLPACYEGTEISVELRKEKEVGCFTRIDGETVVCPMGKLLYRAKEKDTGGAVYQNKDACRQCTNRCTDGKFKTVYFGPGSKNVAVRMYGKPKNRPPEKMVFHNSFGRRDRSKSRVLLRIAEDKEKLKTRMCTVEHPFGTIKWYTGAHYLLCKGKEKAAAEMGLSFLAYNLKRAIKMLGVTNLIKAIKG